MPCRVIRVDAGSDQDQMRQVLGSNRTAEWESSLAMLQRGVDVFHPPDGVGVDDRESGELDLELREFCEDVLGVDRAVSAATGDVGGVGGDGGGGGVFVQDAVAGFGKRLVPWWVVGTAAWRSVWRFRPAGIMRMMVAFSWLPAVSPAVGRVVGLGPGQSHIRWLGL